MEIVGYGPESAHSLYLYVPDFLVARLDDGTEAALTRDGLRLPSCPPHARCGPETAREGSWPFVHRDSMEWFPLADEARLRAEKAKSLFEGVKSMRGRPEETIACLAAAAALVAVDLERTANLAASVAAPGESLADAYARTRNPQRNEK